MRALVRQVDGPGPRAGRTPTAVQDVRPGRAVRVARVGVRAERSAGSGAGAVGTAFGVQVRQTAAGQELAADRNAVVAATTGRRRHRQKLQRRHWQAGHVDTYLAAGARATGRPHRQEGVLRQRAVAPPATGCRAPATVPGRVPEAVRVRGRGRDVHAGRGVPAGQSVWQDVHVRHNAGHGARRVGPAVA